MKPLLTDRVCILSGCGPGTGAAIAHALADEGATLVLASRREESSAPVAAAIEARGGRVLVVTSDVTKPEDRAALVARTLEVYGRVDVLVNAAGITRDTTLRKMSTAQWQDLMRVNLDGVFYITRRAIPVMNDGGAIVTLASVSAHKGGSFEHAHYGATKGGILAYTRGLARDLGPRLRANSVSPGIIDTPMLDNHPAGRTKNEPKPDIPLGRYGKASEVASVIAFLCSDAASYVSGETILITGGQYMG